MRTKTRWLSLSRLATAHRPLADSANLQKDPRDLLVREPKGASVLGWLGGAMMVAALAGCGGGGDDSGGQAPRTPVPTVEVAPSQGTALNATSLDLAASGYTEGEYILKGTASRYRVKDEMSDAELIDSGHPYVTRVIVRRPTDPAKFNGTVVVEWLNVTTGQDIDIIFASTRELLLREGYAFVGATVQRAGAQQLAQWNPARYGNLSFEADKLDPATGEELDPARFPSIGGDVLSFDVFSQISAAVTAPSSPLMGGLAVKRVIASGESQSAVKLTSYYNNFHALHKAYDGYFFYDRAGRLRTGLGAKSVSIATEFSNGNSAADTEDHRWWEIAGAAHLSLAELDGYLDPIIKRDGFFRAPDNTALSLTEVITGLNCGQTPIWSRVPNADYLKAALKSLNGWIQGGAAVPTAPRVVLDGSNGMLRDASGRVFGGIRSAEYDAPKSDTVGRNSGHTFCVLAGSHHDYTPQQMCQRYGSHESYVAQVQAFVSSNRMDGFLLPEEAERTIEEAKAATFTCS